MLRSIDQFATVEFFDHIAKTYRPLARYSVEALAAIRRDIEDAIGAQSITALDVGAGTGYPSRYVISGFPRCDLTLLDIAPGMLVEAGSDETAHLNRVVADGCDLPFRPKAFSLVTTFCALHCFTSQERFLDECRRVLREGAALLIAFNEKKKLKQQLVHALFPGFNELDSPRQCSEKKLNRLLEQRGFKISHSGYREWTQSFRDASDYLSFIESRPFSGFAFYTEDEFKIAFSIFKTQIFNLFGEKRSVTNRGSLNWIIARKTP